MRGESLDARPCWVCGWGSGLFNSVLVQNPEAATSTGVLKGRRVNAAGPTIKRRISVYEGRLQGSEVAGASHSGTYTLSNPGFWLFGEAGSQRWPPSAGVLLAARSSLEASFHSDGEIRSRTQVRPRAAWGAMAAEGTGVGLA